MFGYRIHLISDAVHGVPLTFTLTPANGSEPVQLRFVVQKTLDTFLVGLVEWGNAPLISNDFCDRNQRKPRNVAGNPDSPQTIVFLTPIIDVTVSS